MIIAQMSIQIILYLFLTIFYDFLFLISYRSIKHKYKNVHFYWYLVQGVSVTNLQII